MHRRRFLSTAATALAAGGFAPAVPAASRPKTPTETFALLDDAAARPVLDVSSLKAPVIIEAVEVRQPASDKHEKPPEASVANVEKPIAATGAEAVKFKVGGRMTRNRDSPPGRTEAIIPLMRKRLGVDLDPDWIARARLR